MAGLRKLTADRTGGSMSHCHLFEANGWFVQTDVLLICRYWSGYSASESWRENRFSRSDKCSGGELSTDYLDKFSFAYDRVIS